MATALTTPHEYRLVESAEALRGVVEKLLGATEFCFDTETTGLDLFNDRIVGLSLAVEPYRAWYVPFTPGVEAEYAAIIRPLFESEQIAKSARTSSSTSWCCGGWASPSAAASTIR